MDLEWIVPLNNFYFLDRLLSDSIRFGISKQDNVLFHVQVLKRFAERFENEIDKTFYEEQFNFWKKNGLFFDDLENLQDKRIARTSLLIHTLNQFENSLVKKTNDDVKNLILQTKMMVTKLFYSSDVDEFQKKLEEITNKESEISKSLNVSFISMTLPDGFDSRILLEDRIYFVLFLSIFGKNISKFINVKITSLDVRECIKMPRFLDYQWLNLDPLSGIDYRTIDEHMIYEQNFCQQRFKLLEKVVLCLYHFTKQKAKDKNVTKEEQSKFGWCYQEFFKLLKSKQESLLLERLSSESIGIAEKRLKSFLLERLNKGSKSLIVIEFDDKLLQSIFPEIKTFDELISNYKGKLNVYSKLKKKNDQEGCDLDNSEKMLCLLFDISCLKNSSLQMFKEVYGKSWLANPSYVVPNTIKVQVKHTLHINVLKDWLRLYYTFKKPNILETKTFCQIRPIPSRFLNDPFYFDVSKLYFGFVQSDDNSIRPLDPNEIRSLVDQWKKKYSYDVDSCFLTEDESLECKNSSCPLITLEEQVLNTDEKELLNQILYIGQFRNVSSVSPKIEECKDSKQEIDVPLTPKVIESDQDGKTQVLTIENDSMDVLESNKNLTNQYSCVESNHSNLPVWVSPYYDSEFKRLCISSYHLVRLPSQSAFDIRLNPLDHFNNPIESLSNAKIVCLLPPSQEEWNTTLWNRVCKSIFWLDFVKSSKGKEYYQTVVPQSTLIETVDDWYNKVGQNDTLKESKHCWLLWKAGNLAISDLIKEIWKQFVFITSDRSKTEEEETYVFDSKKCLSIFESWRSLDDRPRILPPLPSSFFENEQDPDQSFLDHLKILGYLSTQANEFIPCRLIEGYWNQIVRNFYGVSEDALQTKLIKLNHITIDHLFSLIYFDPKQKDQLFSECISLISSLPTFERLLFWFFLSKTLLRSDPLFTNYKNIGTDFECENSNYYLFEGSESVKLIASQWKQLHQFFSKEKDSKVLDSFYAFSDLYIYRVSQQIKFLETKLSVCKTDSIDDKCNLLKIEKSTYETMLINMKALQTLSKRNVMKEGLKNLGPLFLKKLDPFIIKTKLFDYLFEDIQNLKPKSNIPFLDPRLIPDFSNFIIPTNEKEEFIIQSYKSKRQKFIILHTELLKIENSTIYSTLRQKAKDFDL